MDAFIEGVTVEADAQRNPFAQDLSGVWHRRPVGDSWIVSMDKPNCRTVCGQEIHSVHVSEYEPEPDESLGETLCCCVTDKTWADELDEYITRALRDPEFARLWHWASAATPPSSRSTAGSITAGSKRGNAAVANPGVSGWPPNRMDGLQENRVTDRRACTDVRAVGGHYIRASSDERVEMGEPTVRVSFTVTIEMTEAQRAAYADRYGVGFVGIEVANRARQTTASALDEAPWLQGFATVKIMNPHDGWYDDWAEVGRDRDGNLVLEYKPTGGRYRVLPEEES